MKTRELKLSKRLQAVAVMVTKGNVVCDVGCDHGFVPVYLVKNGISPKVIAMDINEGPLMTARDHIGEYFLTDYIETRLCDGMAALRAGEADTLICAGMGGRLVIKILEEGREKLVGMKELVLQPQSEVQNVREYLRKQGYLIADENMILEEGKYYPMMQVHLKGDTQKHCGENLSPEQLRIEDKYGPVLLRQKHPVLKEYLQREVGIFEQILDNLRKNGKGQEVRQQEIMAKSEDIQTALSYYECEGCCKRMEE